MQAQSKTKGRTSTTLNANEQVCAQGKGKVGACQSTMAIQLAAVRVASRTPQERHVPMRQQRITLHVDTETICNALWTPTEPTGWHARIEWNSSSATG